MKQRPAVLCMADLTACPAVLSLLSDVADVDAVPADQHHLCEAIARYDAYYASLHVRMDTEVLSRAKRLKVIATASTGTDHIDLAGAAELGIEVISLKNDGELLEGIPATAEMTWCLLLAAVRRLPWAFDAAKQGIWARDAFRGHQLAGMTLGILGFGRLGKMVAEYGRAFRMRVIATDVKEFAAPAVQQVDFDTLLSQSDVLSIHVHLDESTRGLIGRREFTKMRDGVAIVNTSRGAAIDEAALLDALLSGKVLAAGLDVIEGEWRDDLRHHPLIRYAATHDNLVVSPHLGGVTFESQSMAHEHTARKLAAFLQKPETAS